jgi:hypothetical protein
MKLIIHTACLLAAFLSLASCTRTGQYEQKVKTLDSLGGAVNAMVRQLQEIDTLTLQRSVNRYNWYKQFISQHLNDTVTKEEADQLQHFYASGKSLEQISGNRRLILERAALLNTQLARLGEDLRNRSMSLEQLSHHARYETLEAARLIQAGYRQQKVFHASLEEFRLSLKSIELLIRSRNRGELPTIIKDTVAL